MTQCQARLRESWMRRHTRRNVQRIARLAAVGGLLCGGFMVQQAMAGEPAPVPPGAKTSLIKAADTGAGLVSELGTARTAGNWGDKDGNPVVAVTDDKAAAEAGWPAPCGGCPGALRRRAGAVLAARFGRSR
jgi:hypothetical protein